jgi:HD-like signal output (HDOD) protein
MTAAGSAASNPAPQRRIGELLIEAGLITEGQLNQALDKQNDDGGKIVELLIALNHLTPDQFVAFLAKQPGVASIDLKQYDISNDLIDLVPREFVIKHELIPIDRLGKLLTIGMVCPLDRKTIDELEKVTQLRVKPLLCSASDVRSAIEQHYADEPSEGGGTMDGVAASMRLGRIASLIREVDTLPALPETVERVREAANDPDKSAKDVANILVMDPPIMAKVLGVANSAAYGFSQRVDDINHAVALLGLRETFSIVMSAAVINLFDKSKVLNYKRFWLNAMYCAAASRFVVKASGRKGAPGLFSAGLLHDVGIAALAEVSPEQYSKIDQSLTGMALVEDEEDKIGLCHNEAGFALAEHWELPADIAAAIRFHHKVELAEDHQEIAAIVGLADAMACAVGTDPSESAGHFDGLEPAMEVLGIDAENGEAMLSEFLDQKAAALGDSLE